MIVKDIMSTKIVSINSSASVKEAAQLMNKHNIGSVPVLSGKNIDGIITDRDIVTRCIAEDRDAKSLKVSDICSKSVISVNPDQNLSEALNLMADSQVRRLPVVNSGNLVGMLSLADIAREKSGMEISEAISDISMP